MGTQSFFFGPRSWQDEKHLFVYFLTELRTNHLSYSIYEHLCLAKAHKTIEQTGKHLTGNKLQIKKSKKNQVNHVAKK